MKIGDIVLNHHAGLRNPHRYSMFIGYSGKNKMCLCFDGHISSYDNETNLEIVGYLPFKEELKKEYPGKSLAQKN